MLPLSARAKLDLGGQCATSGARAAAAGLVGEEVERFQKEWLGSTANIERKLQALERRVDHRGLDVHDRRARASAASRP